MKNKICLNDIPLNLFLDYFNSTTDNTVENIPLFETDENGNKTPKTNSQGKRLYLDSSGLITTKAIYTNNFYRHQTAIREPIQTIASRSGWVYKTDENNLVILKKNNKEYFAYYKNVIEKINYSFQGLNSSIKNINNNLPYNSYTKLIDSNNGNVGTAEFIAKQSLNRVPVYLDCIDDIPNYIAYTNETINLNSDVSIKREINNFPSNEISGHNAIINVYNRVLTVKNTNLNVELAVDDTIKLTTEISNSINTTKAAETTLINTKVFSAESNNPYAILTLFLTTSNKKYLVNKYLNLSLKTKNGVNILNGKFINSSKNNSGLSVDFNSFIAEVLQPEEINFNSTELINAAKTFNPDFKAVILIKLPFNKIEKILKRKILCNCKSKLYEENEIEKNLRITDITTEKLIPVKKDPDPPVIPIKPTPVIPEPVIPTPKPTPDPIYIPSLCGTTKKGCGSIIYKPIKKANKPNTVGKKITTGCGTSSKGKDSNFRSTKTTTKKITQNNAFNPSGRNTNISLMKNLLY